MCFLRYRRMSTSGKICNDRHLETKRGINILILRAHPCLSPNFQLLTVLEWSIFVWNIKGSIHCQGFKFVIITNFISFIHFWIRYCSFFVQRKRERTQASRANIFAVLPEIFSTIIMALSTMICWKTKHSDWIWGHVYKHLSWAELSCCRGSAYFRSRWAQGISHIHGPIRYRIQVSVSVRYILGRIGPKYQIISIHF